MNKKFAILLIFFSFLMTNAQQNDSKREVIVFIKPQFINYPIMEKREINLEFVEIKSENLSNIFNKYNVETIKRAFPDFLENDTVRFLADGTAVRIPHFANIYVMKIQNLTDVNEFINSLSMLPEINYVESNFIEIKTFSDDPDYYRQWYLNNTGQFGTFDADIDAPESWFVFGEHGSDLARVGVMDVGVTNTHWELYARVVGDQPTDNNLHGTHVAGIIGASHNSNGIKGVNGSVFMVSKRVVGLQNVNEIAQKIIDAVNYPCHILNNSWGGYSEYITVNLAFEYAYENDVSIICSMGNDNTNITAFPAGAFSSLITVGATNANDNRSSFSNWGNHIDITAPGGCCRDPNTVQDIYSLDASPNSYTYRSGTSFSAPLVTGVASLLKSWAINRNMPLHNDDIQELLKMGADDKGTIGWDPYYGSGRLNAYNSLNKLVQWPWPISYYTATGGTTYSTVRAHFAWCEWWGNEFHAFQHEVRKTVTLPVINPKVWGVGLGSRGYSARTVFGYNINFCEVVPGSITSTTATLRTYVYEDDFGGWWPCRPNEVIFNYAVMGEQLIPPVFSRFIQTPLVICKTAGGSGTVQFQLSQGNGDITYHWRHVNKPTGCNVTFNGNTASISFTSAYKPENEGDGAVFALYCWASNTANQTPEFEHKVNAQPSNCGGCPWVFVYNSDSTFEADNNILHRSEFPENNGLDIKDLYKLRVTPNIVDNKILLNIYESENDYSYFDQFKLYAIDHNAGTRIGITENNQLVVYDSIPVTPTDYAVLNGLEITNYVQFHNPPLGENTIQGDSLDHLYSHFPQNSSSNAGIITQLESRIILPVAVKDIAGSLIANTSNGTMYNIFARRENPSEVIIPLSSLTKSTSVYNVDIDYNRNYKLGYIALTNLSYTGFNTTDLPMVEAVHSSTGDIYPLVLSLDQQYAEMANQSFISLKFEVPVTDPFMPLRDYILETNGRYIKLDGTDNKLQIKKQKIPLVFNLEQNYPNPFNPVTKIKYTIPKQSFVKLVIYDMLGREVQSLVSETKEAGVFEVLFNGESLASGIYFYRLEAGEMTVAKKMVLIK